MATKLRQACQNFIVHVRRTYWRETTLLGKRTNFSLFPEFEQSVFRILTGIFGQGGHNRFLRAQMKFFYFLKEVNEGKFTSSFWKLRIAIIFRLCAKRSLVLLQAWLRRLVKKSWYMFRRKFLQRKFLEGLFYFPHLQIFSKIFSEFRRKNFGRVVTTTFIHVHRHIFRKVILLSKSSEFFFRGFWNLSGKCVDSQRKLFATVVKIAFSVAKESFLLKKNLFKKL